MIKHGDYTKAYLKAYPNASKESARSRGHKLSQTVTIATAINHKAAEIASIATQEAVAELKTEIKANILKELSLSPPEGVEPVKSDHVKKILEDLQSEIVRTRILAGEPRIDDRAPDGRRRILRFAWRSISLVAQRVSPPTEPVRVPRR